MGITGLGREEKFGIALRGALASTLVLLASSAGADDAVLTYSTYLGGTGLDRAHAIEVDSEGAIYIVGSTYSDDFPGGECSPPCLEEVFVAKFAADGSQLSFVTFLPGIASYDHPDLAITTDAEGRARAVVVVGMTTATDFPVMNAFQPQWGGSWDGFVSALDPETGEIIYSSYLGGTGYDAATAVVASGDRVYVAGWTTSANKFPQPNTYTTPFDPFHNGDDDVFVVEIAADGELLHWTFLGGRNAERANDITVDSNGNVYVVGETESPRYPVSKDGFDTTCGTDDDCNGFQGYDEFLYLSDGFITKLDADLGHLLYSSFVGGGSPDAARAVAVDDAGDVFVTGRTESSTFPIQGACTPLAKLPGTSGSCLLRAPYRDRLDADDADGFATKIDIAGGGLHYSTYFSRIPDDVWGSPLVVHPDGSISLGLDRTSIARLDPYGSSIVSTTALISDTGSSGPTNAVLVADGSIWVTGGVGPSESLRLAGLPFQPQSGGSWDSFIARIEPCFYSVSSTELSIGGAGGEGMVAVTSSHAGCKWSAHSNVEWLDVVEGSRGEGDGLVRFSVAANTGLFSRSGTLRVAGETVKISQQRGWRRTFGR